MGQVNIYMDGILQSGVSTTFNTFVSTGAFYEHITTTSGSGGSYTVLGTDTVIEATSGTGLIINLPAAVGSGRKILIIQADTGSGLTITPNGADTIEGAATKATTTQYQKCGLIDGASGVWNDIGTGGV